VKKESIGTAELGIKIVDKLIESITVTGYIFSGSQYHFSWVMSVDYAFLFAL